jgi:hypothetical protein
MTKKKKTKVKRTKTMKVTITITMTMTMKMKMKMKMTMTMTKKMTSGQMKTTRTTRTTTMNPVSSFARAIFTRVTGRHLSTTSGYHSAS